MPRWKNVLQTSDEVFRLKRTAVLREATRIIGRRGYHNTSLDDIAESLQVAKGTLYNYVRDKQEILFECHKMALDIGDQAFVFAEEHGGSGYAKLRLFLRAYLTWLNGEMGGGGVTSEVTALRPADRKEVIVRRDKVEARLATYFEQGFDDGTIRRTDARIGTYAIMGAVNSVQGWYSSKGRLSMDAIVVIMVDLLLNGIDTQADAGYVDTEVPNFGSTEAHARPRRPTRGPPNLANGTARPAAASPTRRRKAVPAAKKVG